MTVRQSEIIVADVQLNVWMLWHDGIHAEPSLEWRTAYNDRDALR